MPRSTKQNILDVSERLFKEHGYEETTFQMIAAELGITRGTIRYHFKNKRWILFRFFQQFTEMLSEYIAKNLPEGFRNYYFAACAVNIFFYREVLKNEKNFNLFYTKDNPMLAAPEYLERKEESYRNIMTNFNKTFSDDEIHMAVQMETAVKLLLFEEYKKKDGTMPVDKFCYYIAYTIGLYSGLDDTTIEKNINRAFEFANTHTPPSIPLLT